MLLEHVTEPAQKGFDMPFHGYMAFNRNNSEMDKAKLESQNGGLSDNCHAVASWCYFGPQREVWGL